MKPKVLPAQNGTRKGAQKASWRIFLCKTQTGWCAELEALLGLQAFGKTRKQAVGELTKLASLKLQNAKVERAWWDARSNRKSPKTKRRRMTKPYQ
jgi:hypothetical protein